MKQQNFKIGAAVIVHNMAPLIGACICSLSWVDSIFIYDDHSNDRSIEVAKKFSKVLLKYEESQNKRLVFNHGELEVRNYVINRAFELLDVDLLIIIDADEMLSLRLKPKIIQIFSNPSVDSMAFSIWHLYNEQQYIHFWETYINGTFLIDPHTRIIRRGKYFAPLFGDGSHPIIEATHNTVCLHGPYHFHLKYYSKSNFPNYSLYFLPKRLTEKSVSPYLRYLPFILPQDIKSALSIVDWSSVPRYKETPHYDSLRIRLSDPHEAIIHPKDKNAL